MNLARLSLLGELLQTKHKSKLSQDHFKRATQKLIEILYILSDIKYAKAAMSFYNGAFWASDESIFLVVTGIPEGVWLRNSFGKP